MTANDSASFSAPPIDSQERIRRSLPPFPAVALQLMGLLDSEVPVKQIVGLLRLDPALCGEVLRVSNSALYGLSRQVETVSHAVVILGGDAVKRLALTVALGRFSHQFVRHGGLRACWDHSVACAVGSERLAELLYVSKDVAYTAGLLHDIGKFGLLAAHPDQYDAFLAGRQGQATGLEQEYADFGMHHCQVGGWLAREWNLPQEVSEVIAGHHDEPNGRPLVRVVQAADRVVASLGYSSTGEAAQDGIDEILEGLGFPEPDATAQLLASLQTDIQQCIAAVTPRG